MTENTKNDDGNIVGINRWRDFNDAAPQDPDGIAPMREDFEIESTQGVKERLLRNLRGALAYLLPNGVIKGGKFVVGDVHGSKGDSLTVELAGSKAGLWHDFATGEGGDVIGLWAAATGRVSSEAFPDVMDDIRRWLGGPGPARFTRQAAATSGSKGQPPLDELGPVTAKWDYLDDDGRLIAVVYRYDPPGGKQFRPWDVLARKARAPDPRPLYNRPGIKAADQVILVEGEKAAAALISQGLVATPWAAPRPRSRKPTGRRSRASGPWSGPITTSPAGAMRSPPPRPCSKPAPPRPPCSARRTRSLRSGTRPMP